MEARRGGEVSKGTEAQAEGKSREGGCTKDKGRSAKAGAERREWIWEGERACRMNSSRAGVFSTQGRSAPGIGVGKSFDVSYIADLV